MAEIFNFEDYKVWIRFWVKSLPKRGRGELAKLASAAQMYPSSLSQTLSRPDKHLTLEQSILIADHMGLSDSERKYFLLLVQSDRAGSVRLKKEVAAQIRELKSSRSQIASRFSTDRRLDLDEETIFYSNWLYSAARVFTSIDTLQTVEALSTRLRLARTQTKQLTDFLLQTGLCIEKNGRLEPGPKHTHIEANSPLITRHHANWRVKAMEKHVVLNEETELAYSSPMSLSRADVQRVRQELLRSVERTRQIIDPSPSEAAYCLNIDWFEI